MAVPIRRVATVPSTQDLLHELAAAGAPHGTAVVAAEQTGGRGSRGRGWVSPPGGLWLSVLCRPESAPATEVLSLRVALAAAAILDAATDAQPAGVALKWPNDLLLRDRKLGGILCEARWQGGVLSWVAVGIGVNVANPIPAELADRAIAFDRVAPGIRPEQLEQPLAEAVARAGLASAPLTPAELLAFEARDWLAGRRLAEPAPGIALGIAADGALRVRSDDGRVVAVRSGTVVVAT